MLGQIRKLLAAARATPLHPQFFSYIHEEKNLRDACANLSGHVLDVGCAESRPRDYLPDDAEYIGLDYFLTASGWYETRPDVYGDAQALPLADDSVDHALLLDVLEHLPHPTRCLEELHRVIRPGGSLTIQVPFLYPLHDEPLDFHRWTRHGLRRAASECGYSIALEEANGHPLESAALNANIALSKSTINWIRGRNPLAIMVVALPLVVLTVNCLAWLFAALSRDDDLMPVSYRMVWNKP